MQKSQVTDFLFEMEEAFLQCKGFNLINMASESGIAPIHHAMLYSQILNISLRGLNCHFTIIFFTIPLSFSFSFSYFIYIDACNIYLHFCESLKNIPNTSG